MLEIEQINMEYNEQTGFGKNPNGKEAEIESLLQEWDRLKLLRQKLKNNETT